MNPFERCWLAEDAQARLHGWLSYHAPALQPVARRRLHRRFFRLDPGLVPGRLEVEALGLWARPQGLMVLRDMPPGWRVELTDWDGKVNTEINLPGPKRRLEYLPRDLVAAPENRFYLTGEGEDFRQILCWDRRFEPAIQIEANEAMVAAWVQDGLVYGGWSGRLRWRDQNYELGEPVQALRGGPAGPWVLVRTRQWRVINLEDGQQRLLGGGFACLTLLGSARADQHLIQEGWNGEVFSQQPLASPVVALEWLPRSHQLVALHEDEVLRFYEPGTGSLQAELNLPRSLPSLPTRHSLPFNFAGQSSFHADGRLSLLATSDNSESLSLAPDHRSGCCSFSQGEVEQRYYSDGTVEQFSAWDDNSHPHPQDFEEWALSCLKHIW
ncbi:MAG: hypothetical protein U0931_28555 [Vulcanimicrobiota bacterium]